MYTGTEQLSKLNKSGSPGFSLLKWEVTDEQEEEVRMISVVTELETSL